MRQYHYTQQDFSTREGARAALLRLLEPPRPFCSQGGARVELRAASSHYENGSIPMAAYPIRKGAQAIQTQVDYLL